MVVTKITVVKLPAGAEMMLDWTVYTRDAVEATKYPVYWGRQSEEPGKVWILSDRDNFEDHSNGTDLLVVTDKTRVMTGAEPVASYNVQLPRGDRMALEEPTTEISIGFFQRNNPASSGFEQIVHDFSAKAEERNLRGRPHGTNSAWTVEDDIAFTSLAGQPLKGRGFFSTLGWTSQEAHYTFNQTDFFKQNAEPIVTAGVEGWQIAHVNFQKVGP